LLAAERQQLPGELGGALGGGRDQLDVAAEPVADARLVAQDARAADDDGEQVVEVVGDAAGQAPDRVQALAVPQLVGEAVALRHVVDDHELGGAARELQRVAHGLHVDPLAALQPVAPETVHPQVVRVHPHVLRQEGGLRARADVDDPHLEELGARVAAA
jgi:hypothetical protein